MQSTSCENNMNSVFNQICAHKLIAFQNCRILQFSGNHFALAHQDLWVNTQTGKIVDKGKCFYVEKSRPTLLIDCGGAVLAPGFIELQTNGLIGVCFSALPFRSGTDTQQKQMGVKEAKHDDLSIVRQNSHVIQSALNKVGPKLLEYGVTSYCPTVISSARDYYANLLNAANQMTPSSLSSPSSPSSQSKLPIVQSNFLGFHLEGPMLSKKKSGMHPQRHLVERDPAASSSPSSIATFLDSVYGNGGVWRAVRIVTMAAELPGASDIIRHLTGLPGCQFGGQLDQSQPILVSLGHTSATLDQVQCAVQSGARMLTHLFCAMRLFHHRDPGPVGLLTSTQQHSTETVSSSSMKEAENVGIEKPETDSEFLESPQPKRKRQSNPASVTTTSTITMKERKEMTEMKRESHIYFGVIADKIHTHKSVLRLAKNALPEGLCLVTDSNLGFGMPPPPPPHTQHYMFGEQEIEIRPNGSTYLAGAKEDTLAGGNCSFTHCFTNYFECAFDSREEALGEALCSTSVNPAKALRIFPQKGCLEAGSDADLVVFQPPSPHLEMAILHTWVAGQLGFLDQRFAHKHFRLECRD